MLTACVPVHAPDLPCRDFLGGAAPVQWLSAFSASPHSERCQRQGPLIAPALGAKPTVCSHFCHPHAQLTPCAPLALLSLLVCHTTAVKNVAAAPAAAVSYASVARGLLADSLVFHHAPSRLSLLGAALVCGSTLSLMLWQVGCMLTMDAFSCFDCTHSRHACLCSMLCTSAQYCWPCSFNVTMPPPCCAGPAAQQQWHEGLHARQQEQRALGERCFRGAAGAGSCRGRGALAG
jgi:hypothetical protein